MIWLCVCFNHNKLFSIKRTLVLITFSITSQTIYQTVGSLLNELNVSQDMKFYVQAPKKASLLWNPKVIWIHVSIKVKHVCTYFHLSIFVQSALQCHYQNERKVCIQKFSCMLLLQERMIQRENRLQKNLFWKNPICENDKFQWSI